MSKKRIASISLATKNDDGKYDYDPQGCLLADPEYPGAASIIIEVEHPTRTETGGNGKEYPVKGRLTVAKFIFPPEEGSEESEEVFVDYEGAFLNATFWHAVERSPKAKD